MKIAIIGFSRFGQLWAKLMKPYGEVMVFNRSNKIKEADKLGVEFFSFDDLDKLKEADWIFVAVAIAVTEKIIKKIKPFVKSDALVMDVCSVKTMPCQWLKDNFNDPVQIMGVHPMFGPDSAKASLKGKQIILCPLRISSSNLDKIKKTCQNLELDIIEVTPEEHDRQSAYSLAMVHFLGRGLDKLSLEDIKITTLGFDRLIKIQETVINDSQELFEGLHKFNPYAKRVRIELQDVLKKINNDLELSETNKGD